MNLDFNLPKEKSSIIKILGVGGGGTNAVNFMQSKGILGVNFIVCNTDEQHLNNSAVKNKILLGPELTKGRGTGADPEVGKKATEESIALIKEELQNNTEMLFIAAAMGKGTGTGGSPVVAKLAREMGILTIAIVTTPFSNLGRSQVEKSIDGIEKLKEQVDAIIIVSNDKIREIYGSLKASEAFDMANDVLKNAAKGISEIITAPGDLNTDFNDVKNVLKDGGICIMGVGVAEGEQRVKMAVKKALESPLLNDGDIRGAQKALVNISTSKDHEIQIDEIDEILNEIREASRNDIDIILGTSYDETLNEELCLTIVVTGFDGKGFDKNDSIATKEEEKLEIVNLEQAPNLFSVVSDLELETKYNLSAPLEIENETSYEVMEKEEDEIITMIEKDVLTEEENRKRILNEHSIDLNSPFDLSDLSMTPSMFLESQKSIDANGFVIPKNSVTDSKID